MQKQHATTFLPPIATCHTIWLHTHYGANLLLQHTTNKHRFSSIRDVFAVVANIFHINSSSVFSRITFSIIIFLSRNRTFSGMQNLNHFIPFRFVSFCLRFKLHLRFMYILDVVITDFRLHLAIQMSALLHITTCTLHFHWNDLLFFFNFS